MSKHETLGVAAAVAIAAAEGSTHDVIVQAALATSAAISDGFTTRQIAALAPKGQLSAATVSRYSAIAEGIAAKFVKSDTEGVEPMTATEARSVVAAVGVTDWRKALSGFAADPETAQAIVKSLRDARKAKRPTEAGSPKGSKSDSKTIAATTPKGSDGMVKAITAKSTRHEVLREMLRLSRILDAKGADGLTTVEAGLTVSLWETLSPLFIAAEPVLDGVEAQAV